MSNMKNENLEGEIKSFRKKGDGSEFLAVVRFDDRNADASFVINDFRLENGQEETKKLVIGTRVLVESLEQSPLGLIAGGVKIADTEKRERMNIHGTISRLSEEKGWGAIKYADGVMHFHSSALVGVPFNELAVGEKVLFEIERHPPMKKTGRTKSAASVRIEGAEKKE